MKQRLIIPGIAVFMLLGIGIVSLSIVLAREPYTSSFTPLVQKLSLQFEVSAYDVNDVILDLRDEKRADEYAVWAEELEESVRHGKITNQQKELIIDKSFDIEEDLQLIGRLPKREQEKAINDIFRELKFWSEDRGVSVKQFGRLQKLFLG